MTTDGPQLLDVPTLPNDLATCHALIEVPREQIDNVTRKLTQMEHRLQQLLQKLYGRSSEKIDSKQMALFSELLKQMESQHPQTIESQSAQSIEPIVTPTVSRNGHGRRKLPAELPRERVIHDLPENEKPCPCCGTARTLIGQETSEQLDYVPAQLQVIEHVRLKYMCKSCEKNVAETGPQIVVAEKPLSPIEKGLAAAGLITYVIVSKYDDSLPLHRLEKIFKAITYALNQWTALCVYLLDGDLNIDNNASENALRRIAIGRKNWMFCGSDNGGRTAAILFSLLATCQRHQVEPFTYLRDILTRIASHPHHRLHELLPHNWKPQS